MDWLNGEKVRLRALEPSDLENLYKWENNSELWHVSDAVAPYSRYILKEYIQNAPKDIYENKQLRLIIEQNLKGQNEAVGAVDLFDYDPFHNRAALGIFIDANHQREGIGSDTIKVIKNYAFNYLQLNMLFCHIGEDNPASISFFKKNGFVISGQLKNWLKGLDGYIDSYVLQCLNPKV